MSQNYRLQKYLARAGICSRRAAEELIISGRVSVNGEIITTLGTKVDIEHDHVAFDGKNVTLPKLSTTIMLYKPYGYVTSMARQGNEHIVADLIPQDLYPGLFPIGRLDVDTTGLLLCSNDGELGNALMHPRHHIAKTYQVRLFYSVTHKQIRALQKGVVLDDWLCAPAQVKYFKQDTTRIDLTIYEGRYHQVKRMFEAIGNKVKSLHRVSIGSLDLGDLEVGQWRVVDQREIEKKLTVMV